MKFRPAINVFATFCVARIGWTQEISGTILIKKKLSYRSVKARVPIYQRGGTVRLGQDLDEDPIVYECSCAAIFLEGDLTDGSSSERDIAIILRRSGGRIAG